MQAIPNSLVLHSLADLVGYPGPAYGNSLVVCKRCANDLPADARSDLLAFLDWAGSCSREDVEELYSATFDSNDACALELGWHLYGEAYQRGVFLVEMRQRLRQARLRKCRASSRLLQRNSRSRRHRALPAT